MNTNVNPNVNNPKTYIPKLAEYLSDRAVMEEQAWMLPDCTPEAEADMLKISDYVIAHAMACGIRPSVLTMGLMTQCLMFGWQLGQKALVEETLKGYEA